MSRISIYVLNFNLILQITTKIIYCDVEFNFGVQCSSSKIDTTFKINKKVVEISASSFLSDKLIRNQY